MGNKEEVGIRADLTEKALNASPERLLLGVGDGAKMLPVVIAKRRTVAAEGQKQECWELESRGPRWEPGAGGQKQKSPTLLLVGGSLSSWRIVWLWASAP